MNRLGDNYTDSILQALLDINNVVYLYLIGRFWPDNRYNDAVLQALLKTGNTKYLYLSSKDWPANRYRTGLLVLARLKQVITHTKLWLRKWVKGKIS